MRRFLFLVGLLIGAQLITGGVSAADGQGLSETELVRLANLSEEQIDVGNVALLLASEVFPGLDVQSYSNRLDGMVAAIRRLTKNSADPDQRIRAMNTFLYLQARFQYDMSDPYAHQLKNLYLNGLLDTKSGSCVTMPLLYLALAQRLGYPIYPVAAPQHLFCRYVDPRLKQQNIEATGEGGYSSDADYIEDMEIPSQGVRSGAYLATMTYRQLVGDLIAENGSYWANRRDFPRAIRYYRLALQLNPKAAEVYDLLGRAYHDLAESIHYLAMAAMPRRLKDPRLDVALEQQDLQADDYRRAGDDALKQARVLGVAPPALANYWVRQQQIAQARAAREAAKQP